jgi:hypothetical protein
VERYLVIWCPELLEQKEEGRERRAFQQVVEAVSSLVTRIETVRPGVCAIPTRGPSRYFGGDLALSKTLAERVTGAVPGISAGIGVADGLFAAVLAAQIAESGAGRPGAETGAGGTGAGESGALLVPVGGTPAFLSSWPVGVLERPELADLLLRLGIRTLGQFAALPKRHVLARFGTDGAACHKASAGQTGELPGLRLFPDPKDARPKDIHGDPGGKHPVVRQPGFWGGTADTDVKAGLVIARMQEQLGPEEVLSGRLQGGRSPSERARLVPIDSRTTGTNASNQHPAGGGEPWPGRLPPPSPAIVLAQPLPVALADSDGQPVVVSARVLLSSPPARVSVAGGPWAEVAGWAGPWPADGQWWAPGNRRRARVQLVTTSGAAQLLAAERGGWWLEGVYD